VTSDRILTEAFGGAPPKSSAVDAVDTPGPATGMATFVTSGKSIPVHAGQTVLDAAAAAGVAIDRGCLAGVCGRCKVRMLSGNVAMGECEALGPSDREAGMILACQARLIASIAIEA